MKFNTFSKTGNYHIRNGQQNQDYFCSVEGKDFVAVLLADGATGCKMGGEGARVTCETIAKVAEREGKSFFNYPKEKISYLLSEQILYGLENNMNCEYNLQEYGSTFSLAYMDKKTGRTVMVNLGDSAILSVKDEWSFLMKPKRHRGNPCLTTTKGADRAIEVDVVNLAMGQKLFLCSDGFWTKLEENYIEEKFVCGDLEGLNEELSQNHCADDCSYISFTRGR